jgi:hypothetical protein
VTVRSWGSSEGGELTTLTSLWVYILLGSPSIFACGKEVAWLPT